MISQILTLSSQKKLYPTLCASARIIPLSMLASWRLMMLFWAFPTHHLQMTPSCKISKELTYFMNLHRNGLAVLLHSESEENVKTKPRHSTLVHLVMQAFSIFLFFNFCTTDLYFVLHKCVYLRNCYSSGILL